MVVPACSRDEVLSSLLNCWPAVVPFGTNCALPVWSDLALFFHVVRVPQAVQQLLSTSLCPVLDDFIGNRKSWECVCVRGVRVRATYDAGSGNRTRDTLLGGECSHHCATPASRACLHANGEYCYGVERTCCYQNQSSQSSLQSSLGKT